VRLAFDPAVPHRDALLEGGELRSAGRLYAKYRVGESLRVVHRLRGGGHVAVRTFPDSEAGFRAAGDGAVHLPELGAVLWRFPHDRRIAALPLLAGRSAALDRLAGRPGLTPRLVAYCAERSATAECVDRSGRVVAYAKVHAGEGAERERTALAGVAVAGDARLRVPRLLGADGPALAVEAVEGRRLDTLDATELPAAVERLGAALATLHERAAVPERRFERLDVHRLARAVGVIARARPDAGTAAADLLGWLLDRRADAAGPPVCVHGDASLRNAILANGRVALIDFEDASAAPAAADLGRVLAALLATGVASSPGDEARLVPGGHAAAAAEALLRGYSSVRRPPEPASLRWHAAASVLVRTALPAISRVRPHVLARLRPLLEGARG
jgi:aminoglycoside phosphotransferase